MFDEYRRSRSQTRLPSQPSPPRRDYDTYDYFFDAPVGRSHRSRSLDNRRQFYDDYEFGDNRFERNTAHHATMPKRTYNYQPYMNGPRHHLDEPYFDSSSAQHARFQQHYSPRSAPEGDWTVNERFVRNYPDEAPSGKRYAHEHPMQGVSPRSGSSLRRYNLLHFFDRGQHSRSGHAARSGKSAEQQKVDGTRGPPNEFLQGRTDVRNEPIPVGVPPYSPRRSFHHDSRPYGNSVSGPGGYPDESPPKAKFGGKKLFAKRSVNGEQKFYKIYCCCMSFYWPPWRFEEVGPPQPMYRH